MGTATPIAEAFLAKMDNKDTSGSRTETAPKFEVTGNKPFTKPAAADRDISASLEESLANFVEAEIDSKPASILPVSPSESAERPESQRMREVHRRQAAVTEMLKSAGDGASIFNTLADQINVLTEFLSKTEMDLQRLDKLEADARTLRENNQLLVAKYRDLESRSNDQLKKISVLETIKQSNRAAIETKMSDINRLIEVNKAKGAEIATLNGEIGRYADDLAAACERRDELASANVQKDQKLLELERAKAETANSLREIQQSYKVKCEDNITLKNANEDLQSDISELKAKYDALKAKMAEMQGTMEESDYQSRSARADLEEKLRLKDARIADLETEVSEVSEKLVHAENVIMERSRASDKIKAMQAHLDERGERRRKNVDSKSSAAAE